MYQQQRPHSAPTSLVKLHFAQEKENKSCKILYCHIIVFSLTLILIFIIMNVPRIHKKNRIPKDFQLCPWNSGPPTPQRKDSKKSRDNKNINSKSFSSNLTSRRPPPVSYQQGSKSKCSSKLYLRNVRESKLNFEIPFRHLTDTKRYIRDYREQKMVRMHQEYSEEIENFLSHQTCSHEPPPLYNAAVGGSSGGNYGGGVKYNSIDTNNNNNTSSSFEHDQHHHCYERGFYLGSAIGYRFGVGKVYEEKLRKQNSPMRVRGKCLDQDEERRKFPDKKEKNSSNRQRYFNLPNCESVFTPSKPTAGNSSTYQATSQQNSDHPLQCRKVAELTIQKAPQYYFAGGSSQQSSEQSWLKNHRRSVREALQLRSAEERKRMINMNKISSSPSSSSPSAASKHHHSHHQQQQQNDYNHIIKRVLEHYDPSKNEVRASSIPSHAQQKQQQQQRPRKSLLATT